MAQTNNKRRSRLQNVLILLLSISAAFLFYLNQFGMPHFSALQLPFTQTGESLAVTDERVFLREMDWPVTVLTADSFGGRRELHLSTGDSSFTAAEGLLEDSFRGELLWEECGYAAFRAAMDESSLCILLPNAVPMQVIAARLGLPSAEQFSVSAFLFSRTEESVLFYYSDGTQYFQSSCPLTGDGLSTVIEALGGEECTLADETEGIRAELNSLTACSAELPSLPLLTGATAESLSSLPALLPQFGFNAHTTNRYTEADGTEVIVESPRRLRITPAGTVHYSGDRKNAPDSFILPAQDDLTEIIGSSYHLLQSLLNSAGVKTQLYLSSVQQSGEGCTLCFEAMAGGLSVLAGSGETAGRVVIADGIVTELSLRYRSYTISDAEALLLPFPQALAVASSYEGMRMDVSYIDSAREEVAPAWFMR